MAIVPQTILTDILTDYFVTPVVKVALFNNTGATLDFYTTWADVEPYVVADGYLGYSWQLLDLAAEDIIPESGLVGFEKQLVSFGRDSSSTPLDYNGVVVFQEDQVGTDHVLLGHQQTVGAQQLKKGQSLAVYIDAAMLN